jgi:hypothetical protein
MQGGEGRQKASDDGPSGFNNTASCALNMRAVPVLCFISGGRDGANYKGAHVWHVVQAILQY